MVEHLAINTREGKVPYVLRGRLCGFICAECPEPLSAVSVRLYRSRTDQNVTALALELAILGPAALGVWLIRVKALAGLPRAGVRPRWAAHLEQLRPDHEDLGRADRGVGRDPAGA